ncbi:MAG: hypothetical protein HY755_03665 [Nitrospirae bacterium]|nr:hypothetical protein [Nitrospirota bacterium]
MAKEIHKDFFIRYHAAIFKALGLDAVKLNVKIGNIIATEWLNSLEKKPETLEELRGALESFLNNELRFSRDPKIKIYADGRVEVDIKRCHICDANELLRGKGEEIVPICPVSQVVKSVLSRGIQGYNVNLYDPTKNGRIGECILNFKMFKKPGR